MKAMTIFILLGLLVTSVTAGAIIGLDRSDTIIPFTPKEQANITDARIELMETGEVKCNSNNCWVRVWFKESNRTATNVIAIKGVTLSSTNRQIEIARINAIKEFSLRKAKLLKEANIKRDERNGTETKLGEGCINNYDCIPITEEPGKGEV